jgi:hypothetical protein
MSAGLKTADIVSVSCYLKELGAEPIRAHFSRFREMLRLLIRAFCGLFMGPAHPFS